MGPYRAPAGAIRKQEGRNPCTIFVCNTVLKGKDGDSTRGKQFANKRIIANSWLENGQVSMHCGAPVLNRKPTVAKVTTDASERRHVIMANLTRAG